MIGSFSGEGGKISFLSLVERIKNRSYKTTKKMASNIQTEEKQLKDHSTF